MDGSDVKGKPRQSWRKVVKAFGYSMIGVPCWDLRLECGHRAFCNQEEFPVAPKNIRCHECEEAQPVVDAGETPMDDFQQEPPEMTQAEYDIEIKGIVIDEFLQAGKIFIDAANSLSEEFPEHTDRVFKLIVDIQNLMEPYEPPEDGRSLEDLS